MNNIDPKILVYIFGFILLGVARIILLIAKNQDDKKD